jgi:hypothetical protein
MIHNEVVRIMSTMFGMSDPAQTIQQIERYSAEGRLELAEVMATEFCQMMLTKHQEDVQQLVYLVKGLRLLCSIHLLRGKGSEGLRWIKKLHTFRNKLYKYLRKNAPHLLESLPSSGEDYHLAANLFSQTGKKGAAKKMYKKSAGILNKPLEVWSNALLNGITDQSTCGAMVDSFEHHKGVSRVNGRFFVMSSTGSQIEIETIKKALEITQQASNKFEKQCKEHILYLEQEMSRIDAGERAANAQLESALQNLQPKHDYYEYG